jgi:eukaryotic translation initiation factor 2C
VKYAADSIGLTTQCVKWKNIDRQPKGYVMNVLLKINTKMGGTCHTLSSRLVGAPTGPKVFQDPPASLSWVFDKPCMLVGIDVSHPDPGSDRRSVAAVVGSMNGQASQYVTHISSQAPRVEIVAALEEAMSSLFATFRQRNKGAMPQHVVVYRDGVGDGQFNEVLDRELPCIQNALSAMGTHTTKISIIVCQKKHNTRIAYEENHGSFINACPGVCIDSSGDSESIASATFNEFYLNSHTAIQGTAKATKYSLLYDEIGFKMSELELLTYWSCYLYARCNKSVSLATPAYYAHWASRRAKYLFTAGASEKELAEISNTWSEKSSTMFFI